MTSSSKQSKKPSSANRSSRATVKSSMANKNKGVAGGSNSNKKNAQPRTMNTTSPVFDATGSRVEGARGGLTKVPANVGVALPRRDGLFKQSPQFTFNGGYAALTKDPVTKDQFITYPGKPGKALRLQRTYASLIGKAYNKHGQWINISDHFATDEPNVLSGYKSILKRIVDFINGNLPKNFDSSCQVTLARANGVTKYLLRIGLQAVSPSLRCKWKGDCVRTLDITLPLAPGTSKTHEGSRNSPDGSRTLAKHCRQDWAPSRAGEHAGGSWLVH